jgi:predicted phage-related endonuclease
MDRETIIPKDEADWLRLRTLDITSTDVAALFDISPWLTKFELYHRKKSGAVVELEPNARMLWGQRLERSISEGIAEDYKLDIRHMKEYIRVPAWRIGSSFDNAVGDDGILEVKNVDGLAYKDGWLVNGDSVEAPPHIEIQLQHQLLVSGRKYGLIGALIGGNRVTLIKREADPVIHEAIKSRVAAFWQSIDANQEPAPDFRADADFIAKLSGYAEPGKVIMAHADTHLAALVRDYKEWGEKATAAQAEKDGIKAQILLRIEDAEKVQGDGWTISAGMTPPTLIEAYTRKGFRNFKIFIKKEKTS